MATSAAADTTKALPRHPEDLARLQAKALTEVVFAVGYETQSPNELLAIVGSLDELGTHCVCPNANNALQ